MARNKFNVALARSKRKKEVNDFFALNTSAESNVLFLESKNLKTFKALYSVGHKKKRMWVPNPYNDYHKIKQEVKNTYKMALSEFLPRFQEEIRPRLRERGEPDKFGGSYNDYMSVFNKAIREDLRYMFSNDMFEDEAVLGVTCRALNEGNKKNKGGFLYENMRGAINFIQRLALQNGYVTILQNCGGPYKNEGSLMWSIWFKMVKL